MINTGGSSGSGSVVRYGSPQRRSELDEDEEGDADDDNSNNNVNAGGGGRRAFHSLHFSFSDENDTFNNNHDSEQGDKDDTDADVDDAASLEAMQAMKRLKVDEEGSYQHMMMMMIPIQQSNGSIHKNNHGKEEDDISVHCFSTQLQVTEDTADERSKSPLQPPPPLSNQNCPVFSSFYSPLDDYPPTPKCTNRSKKKKSRNHRVLVGATGAAFLPWLSLDEGDIHEAAAAAAAATTTSRKRNNNVMNAYLGRLHHERREQHTNFDTTTNTTATSTIAIQQGMDALSMENKSNVSDDNDDDSSSRVNRRTSSTATNNLSPGVNTISAAEQKHQDQPEQELCRHYRSYTATTTRRATPAFSFGGGTSSSGPAAAAAAATTPPFISTQQYRQRRRHRRNRHYALDHYRATPSQQQQPQRPWMVQLHTDSKLA